MYCEVTFCCISKCRVGNKVICYRLFAVICRLFCTSVCYNAVNSVEECVTVDSPCRVLAVLTSIKSSDELSLLAAVKNDVVLYYVLKPCLVCLPVVVHVLVVGNVVECRVEY